MNKELILALEALEKENGISKDIMLDTIEKSLREEFKQEFNTVDNCEVTLDRVTGDFHIYALRTVVDELTPGEAAEDAKKSQKLNLPYGREILLEDAKKIDPKCQAGDIVKIEIKSEAFSRRAAKNAKGIIVQKIREEEKAAIYNEYHSKENEIITGIVQRIDEKGNVLVDIGRTQTTLRKNECVKGETFQRGDRIKLYVLEVSNSSKNANNTDKDKEKSGSLIIKVSRKTPLLVKRLFEQEVSEIKDGIVKIVSIAREEGSRTKIAVKAEDPNVDPVGACVGVNGARVRAIVNELGNEQIDVIEWSDNPAQYIFNALSPAKAVSISAYDDENLKKATVVVSDQQLSLAIGKAGQNVRLAAKLTGYSIDIKSESAMEMENGNEETEYDSQTEGEETLEFTENTSDVVEE